tara:strand:+ start:2300 stop:2494 length:195 start_codon:yes stop_codon:yes gene_type:complete
MPIGDDIDNSPEYFEYAGDDQGKTKIRKKVILCVNDKKPMFLIRHRFFILVLSGLYLMNTDLPV